MKELNIISAMLAFFVTAVMAPIVIPFLKKVKCGQQVRDDGPKSHMAKNGTPTMGGILILFGVAVASIISLRDYPKAAPILFLMIGFGMIGFLDDYLKIIFRNAKGLTPLSKLAGQFVVTAMFAYYLVCYTDMSLAMRVPFASGLYVDFGRFNVPVLFFVVLGTVNGVNFTDGLDGLAGSVTTIVAVYFTVIAIGTQSGIEPITCAVAGALLGFLLFNVHPASVFMGDTGSLALGGFVAACGYMLQMPLFIAIVGIVYLVEVASVIVQVVFYKITRGRRILKMAPIHHHFELCGWSETKIVAVFSIVTAIMCLVSLYGFA